ncbi:MAG: hypothetical protein B7Y45_00125 [Sphingomonas sp. 28-66-16]|nr:MAG: hypothetical protein B7Y45_00125 [Sphingomonas sp. 28-66-16]
MPTTLPRDWISAALELTGHFEEADAPWSAVSGNFDGMGVSLGVLQWNFGQGSLQPLVRRAGRASVEAAMPTIGAAFWAASANGADWRTIVAAWHDGKILKAVPLEELRAFTGSAAFVDQQIDASSKVAGTAYKLASTWANSDPLFGAVSRPLFCWFFDLMTQNGGLKGLTIAELDRFRASTADPIGLVCDWLASQPSSISGFRDARRNAQLWRTPGGPREDALLLLSYLRCLRSSAPWQVDVLNRKGSIARAAGWVHGERQNLTRILGSW